MPRKERPKVGYTRGQIWRNRIIAGLVVVIVGVLALFLIVFPAINAVARWSAKRHASTPVAASSEKKADPPVASKEQTPTTFQYYSLDPKSPDFHPHRLFNENMDRIQAWTKHRPDDGYLRYAEPAMKQTFEAYYTMVKYRKQLGIPHSTLVAKYARLWSYYNYANLEYDKQTEQQLQKAAKLVGVKYKTPACWAE